MALRNIIGTTIIAAFVCTTFFCCANRQIAPSADLSQPSNQEGELTEKSAQNTEPIIEGKNEEPAPEEPVEAEIDEAVPAKKIPVTPIIRKKEVPAPEPESVAVKKEEPREEVKPALKKEEPPAPPPVEDKNMEEYKRSVAENTAIDYDTFAEDKKQILQIIEELIVIMKDGDDVKWRNYVEKSSIAYWSDASHLAAYSKKLPQKTVRMKTLKDYFKWVFVPSRKGQTIDEIRYISNENIKAVQVRDDKDIVYYYFRKENGKWKIYLPTM